MTIKYEPVFGDQSLFYNAQADCEMVGNGHHKVEHGKLMVWNFSEKYWAESHTSKISMEAMRRIIKTPTWTRADQEAGVLPEVGALLVDIETGDQFSFVGVIAGSKRWACKDACDGLLYFFESHEMSPIETPEEKAARLKDEWCDSVNSKCGHMLGLIYDALLSGELKAPAND